MMVSHDASCCGVSQHLLGLRTALAHADRADAAFLFQHTALQVKVQDQLSPGQW